MNADRQELRDHRGRNGGGPEDRGLGQPGQHVHGNAHGHYAGREQSCNQQSVPDTARNTSAPKDADRDDEPTINLLTKNPAFQINEELDSLSIRYHEVGGGKAIVQDYRPGNSRLETVGSLVTWPVNDTTFIETQGYDLEILAIDLAGNATAQAGGILTFKKGFGNPDADMFTIAAVPKDKGVAGVDFTVALSVLDTTLTRIEGDAR